MRKDSHTVCMTVTHPLRGQQQQPLLSDELFDLVGTSPEFLYGLQGDASTAFRRAISDNVDLIWTNGCAEMTFSIPGNTDVPLLAPTGPTLQVFDHKRCYQAQRDAFVKLFLVILERHYDDEMIERTIGEPAYKADLLTSLTLRYPQHLPEAMRATDLKIGIFVMPSNHGLATSVAMIARDHIQTFVKEIKGDPGDRAFSYRVHDKDGVERHIDLPPMVSKTVPHAIRKDFRNKFTPTVELTVVTNASEPGDVIELDALCTGAIGSDITWIVGYADHRFAHRTPTHCGIATAVLDHPFRRFAPTRTMLTLSSPDETWPDCSRDDRLASLRFFHPDYVSAATLRAFIALLKDEFELEQADTVPIKPHWDDRRVLDHLVLAYPIYTVGALERTGIDVAVLPTRWKDGSVGMVTMVRRHRLKHYVRSMHTVGITGPMRYVINYDDALLDPNWIELNRAPVQPSRRIIDWTPEEVAEWAEMNDERNFIMG